MKTGRPFRMLSNRVKALVVALIGIALLLLILHTVALPGQGTFWLICLAGGLLLACALLYYFFLYKPFQKLERMMDFFSEGYTLSGLNQTHPLSLSPASERLLHRFSDEFSAQHLLKLSKRQAQYHMLQNQINPHFLYNTLESIRSEALIGGLKSVADMTEALAVFFRYTISKVENLVSLEEELQNCKTYFHIQQYRFGPRLQLRIECDAEDMEEIYRSRLPKLTLQPILENSIIHGTESKIGAGNLVIHLSCSEQRLFIRISDDGVGMDEATLSRLNERLGKSGRAFQGSKEDAGGGLALANVNNRIHLLFGEAYGLHIYSMQGVGTDVQITLPLVTSDRDVANREVLK